MVGLSLTNNRHRTINLALLSFQAISVYYVGRRQNTGRVFLKHYSFIFLLSFNFTFRSKMCPYMDAKIKYTDFPFQKEQKLATDSMKETKKDGVMGVC